jgi:hypothetical protein
MDQMAQDNELRSALAAFETSVTSPVVSGDLVDWTEKVAKSWNEASTRIHFQLKHSHPRQFEEIANADAALLRQVELMRSEDEAIEADREKLSQTVSRIAHHVPKMEPDEAKAQPHIHALLDQAIPLIARVRKQEVTVQTWFAEAFNRERGGGD